jgi:lactate dehydrogenase-like 2-hydroxyacid dehydrogenase|tara:strand:+ start:174 stop:1181 length:1008 start_codon:yes stop_codon:yes gene_type:complete
MSNKVVVLGPTKGDIKSKIDAKTIKELNSYAKNYKELELFYVDTSQPIEKVIEQCKNALVIFPTTTFPEITYIAEKIPSLKLIQTFSAGTDWLDKIKLSELGVDVANNNGANAVAVAEHAINLMFSVNRKLDQQITSVKNGKWMDDVKGDLEEFHTLVDKRIGIIGLGRIGSRVAKRLRGWECELVYYDNLDFETNYIKDSGAKYLELHELLETSDIITIHVPLDRTTKHMISKDEFRLMKKTAIFINTCRGPVVDEKAMIEALLNNEIFAAGLDVTEIEPIEINNPLLKMENVIITPHLATRAIESQKNAYENSLKNATRIVKGEKPQSIIKAI